MRFVFMALVEMLLTVSQLLAKSVPGQTTPLTVARHRQRPSVKVTLLTLRWSVWAELMLTQNASEAEARLAPMKSTRRGFKLFPRALDTDNIHVADTLGFRCAFNFYSPSWSVWCCPM